MSASLVAVFGGSAVAQVAPDPPALPDDGATTPMADPDPPLSPTSVPAQPSPSLPGPHAHDPTGKFQIGAGYGTDSHFFAHAGISQSNLFGSGDFLALDAQMSSLQQLFEVRFIAPHFLDSDFSFAPTLYNERRVLPGFTRETTGGTFTLSHAIGDHTTVFGGYRLEDVTATPDDLTIAARGETVPTPLLRGGTISALRAGIAYSTLDYPAMPLHGSSAGMTAELAEPWLGSDFQLTRINTWANTHQSIGPFTLHLGGSLASVTSSDPFGVPLNERLFLDGSSQIRGFAPGALGPVDPLTGLSLGGNFLVTGHAELEVPVSRRLGLS
ncbi:MAG TPA: BamA/TamA family outer membrane protein, partial [Kofleriaceae bacterium]|nr:BamA/TamA family outer membrane protein [Kofleriaceae bacterium]